MKDYVFAIIFVLLGAALGFAGNEAYRVFNNHRDVNGLWIPKNYSHIDAIKTAQNYDTYGDWICVNINGMSIQEMIDTCEHEASHEIFAEYCEKDPIKCLEAVS